MSRLGEKRDQIVQLIKFSASSLIAFGVDYGMYMLLTGLTAAMDPRIGLAVSEVCARLISSSVNFLINRKLVFAGDESFGRALGKYALLAAGVLVVNYLLMLLLTDFLGWPDWISKILVEVTLYLINFVVQRKFVYTKKPRKE